MQRPRWMLGYLGFPVPFVFGHWAELDPQESTRPEWVGEIFVPNHAFARDEGGAGMDKSDSDFYFRLVLNIYSQLQLKEWRMSTIPVYGVGRCG